MKIADFTNGVDPDEVAHHEPPYLDLHCFALCPLMDGWMACNFTSFSTFQSYQDNGQMIMKGCVQ